MKGNTKIIKTLNELLAGELTAIDQYLIHGEMYADMGLTKLAEKTLHESEKVRTRSAGLWLWFNPNAVDHKSRARANCSQ